MSTTSKKIGQFDEAPLIGQDDLLIVEQSGVAKKVAARTLAEYFTTALEREDEVITKEEIDEAYGSGGATGEIVDDKGY